MKKRISIQYSSLRISAHRMIFVFTIPLFVSQSILHAEIETGSFDFDGRLRDYMVYLPNDYTGSIDFPLVIHLHSGGWTAQQDMDYIKLNQVADTSGFIVVYPSAINKRWHIEGSPAPNPDVDDVGFINALIDIMINRYSIDLERIYACGYSRGGFLAYTLAFQLSHRIAAIASVSGGISSLMAESYNPIRPMPILHIHGTADTWIPINGGSGIYSADQTLSYWTNFSSCVQTETITLPDLDTTDGCTVEKTTYTNCSDNCEIVYYKVIDGGHTWPGAGPPGYAAGNTNQDFDASVEIWNFFKNHKLIIPPVVDFNGDGVVDFRDFCRFAQSWYGGESSADIAAGLSGEQSADYEDLARFAEHWLADSRLLAHWTLDETEGYIAHDEVGGGGDAWVMAVEPGWRPEAGAIGGALELNSAGEYVKTNFVLDPADGSFSVFAWVKGEMPGQVVISQEGTATWLMADAFAGYLTTDIKTLSRGEQPLISETVITDGQWHRIGLVRDIGSLTLYVDDAPAASGPDSGLRGSQAGLHIGAGRDRSPGSFWSGLIDDVRIYNRAIEP